MKVVIIGKTAQLEALAALKLEVEDGTLTYCNAPTHHDLERVELLIDLTLDENPERLEGYLRLTGAIILGCAVRRSLARMWHEENLHTNPHRNIFGLNALPGGFLATRQWEVSALYPEQIPVIQAALAKIGVSILPVADAPGMVTARILAMIINEAFYTAEEGAATPDAIDMAMRLGVNYPDGPFTWANKIGIRNIVAVLEGLLHETNNPIYRPARTLKRATYLQD